MATVRILVVCVLFLLAVPAAGTAQTELVRGDGFARAPELAGRDVVYAQWSGGRRSRLMAGAPGRDPRTLRTVVGLEAFAAAPGRLAFTHAEFDAAGEEILRGRISAGPLDGPYADVLDCLAPRGILLRGVDLDGDRLGASGAGCADDRVLVRDLLPGGGAWVLQAPAAVWGRVAVAGPFVAFMSLGRSDSRLLVHEVGSGARIYETQLGDVSALDMEADGTVVTLQGANPPVRRGPCYLGTVRRHTPGDPAGRVVSGQACGEPGGVRIAAGRVAFVRPVGGQRQIVLADPAPGAVQPVVNLRGVNQGFDYDGRSVAWHEQGCMNEGIYFLDLAGPSAPRAAPDCPVRVGPSVLRLARDRTVGVRLRCPEGCRGQLGFLVPRFLHYTLGAPGESRLRSFRLQPGRSVVVRLRLDRRQAARVRRRGRVAVAVKVIHALGSTTVRRSLRAR
jgi:hypothetical protein